ncbi:hypothetical protein [Proteus terrae]|uniref:hypothetical protein n=1 Tax=Proteus terrae TaxID=1574161 RepID=UPI000D696FA2|nr:hypothetical protein [Proteus terrae]
MSFILGVLSGAIAIFLGLHKFYREKWWDKQFNVFSDLVDHIYTIKVCTEYFQSKIEQKLNPDDDHYEQIIPSTEVLSKFKESSQALVDIQGKVRFLAGSTLGDLLVKYIDDIAKLEYEYIHNDYDDNDVFELYDKQLDIIEKTSCKIIELSRETLRRDSILSGLNEKFWLLKYPKKFKTWCLTN